jgi:hypothetical protein
VVKSAEKVANVSSKDLARYFELEEQRASLARQSKDLGKLQEELEEKFVAWVKAHGGPEQATMRCGYKLAILVKPGSVAWKTEFMKAVEDGAKRAEELTASAPKKEVLVVEPPPASE